MPYFFFHSFLLLYGIFLSSFIMKTIKFIYTENPADNVGEGENMRNNLRVAIDECGTDGNSFDERREAMALTNWYENDIDKSLDTRDLDWWAYVHESELTHIARYLKDPCGYGKPFKDLFNNKVFHQLMWNNTVFYSTDDLKVFAACMNAVLDDFICYAKEELEMLLDAIMDLFRKDENAYETLCDSLNY